MKGNDLQVYTTITVFPCSSGTQISSVLHTLTDVVRPDPFSAEMRRVKYWFMIIPQHQGHKKTNCASVRAFSPRHCNVTMLWQQLLMWTLIIQIHFLCAWCSLRSGCRPLIKHQPTHTHVFSVFCLYPWQEEDECFLSIFPWKHSGHIAILKMFVTKVRNIQTPSWRNYIITANVILFSVSNLKVEKLSSWTHRLLKYDYLYCWVASEDGTLGSAVLCNGPQ